MNATLRLKTLVDDLAALIRRRLAELAAEARRPRDWSGQ